MLIHTRFLDGNKYREKVSGIPNLLTNDDKYSQMYQVLTLQNV